METYRKLLSVLGLAALLMTGGGLVEAASTASGQGMPAAVGAFPAPPMGPGSGNLALWSRTGSAALSFAPSGTLQGNSFFVAASARKSLVYIPTEAGVTDIFSLKSRKVIGQFASLPGGRVARLVLGQRALLVLSGKALALYSTTAPYQKLFEVPVGGNALALNPNGHTVYVGGNMDSAVYAVSLANGRIVRQYAARRSGDLVWAHGQLFSADIKTGVMSIIHVHSGMVVRVATPEVDPSFSYGDIPAATAGFMQLAVSPNQHWVYAAGFSGHILKFSAVRDQYMGEIRVAVPGSGPRKLSGLLVLEGGQRALVTVENLDETAVVKLATGQVMTLTPKLASNRWVAWPGSPR